MISLMNVFFLSDGKRYTFILELICLSLVHVHKSLELLARNVFCSAVSDALQPTDSSPSLGLNNKKILSYFVFQLVCVLVKYMQDNFLVLMKQGNTETDWGNSAGCTAFVKEVSGRVKSVVYAELVFFS